MTPSQTSAAFCVAISVLAGCGSDENQAGLTGTQSVASPLIADEGFWMGVYHPINNVILAERDGIQLVANGNVALSFADSDFEGTVDPDDHTLDTFRASVGLDGALTIEVAVEGSGALESELPLATIALPPIKFAGDTVTVTPYVQMLLLVEGTAAAAARVSLVAPFHVGATFTKKDRHRTDLSSDPQFTAEVGLPELSGNFDGTVRLQVTTTFLVAIQGFEVGGPVVGTRLGAHLQVALAPESTWDLEGLVSLLGGWAFRDPTTGLPDVPDNVLERHFPPMHIADGPIPNELGPSTRWSRAFAVERHDIAGTALLGPEGEIVVVESGVDEPWLASLTAAGVPSWQHTATDAWTPKAMARAQDGDLLVAGIGHNHEIRVERYDPSGSPRWRSTLTVPGAEVTFKAILATSGGDDTVTVNDVTYDDGTNRLLVAALDAEGNLEWSKEIETGAGSSNASIEALAETPSGGILAVGKVDYADTGATIDGTNALVLHLDADGNPGAAYAVGGTHLQVAHSVAVYPDGSYVIGGEQDVFAPHIAWIASLRADDTLRWSASYQSRPYNDSGEQASVTGLAPLTNHGLLVSGHIGTPDTDAFMFRLGEEGMPFWAKTYKSPDDDRLLSVLALTDGFIAFGDTGFTDEVSSNTDLWAVRCNKDGMVPFAADSGFVVENSAVQWTRVFDHNVHPLAPTIVATSTLVGGPAAFTTNAATVVGELLTY